MVVSDGCDGDGSGSGGGSVVGGHRVVAVMIVIVTSIVIHHLRTRTCLQPLASTSAYQSTQQACPQLVDSLGP